MSGTITVPAATRSVITATPKTTFKVGSYNPLTDVFTSTLDLNDHVNYWLVSADLAQPQKVYARTSTIRAPGERISAWNYQNRHITLTLQLLYEANSTGLLAALRALLAAIENPPYRLAFAAPNSTVLTYADVVAVTSTIPYDGKQLLAGITTKISIDFECAPGFSGDRITLSNLVVNPGFEAPSGPPLGVFADSIATLNAYTASGGALTQDVTTYSDVVMADAPIRYYRLDESAGPTVADASLSAQNGTGFTGIGFLQTGALNGSSDTAASFNGTTGYVDVPTTGLPTGNAAWTLEGWFKTSASGINGFLWDFGTNASKQGGQLYVNSSNKLVGGFNLSALTSSGTVNNGAWHHAAVTWDGTSLTLYLDGAVVAGPTAGLGPGAIALNKASVGQQESFGGNFFNGTLDECALYATALSSTRILAHYNAGHNAPSAAANTLKLPAGASATFGSSAWGSINTWQVRFRYNTGMTAFFDAHAPGGNNTLGAEVGAGTLYAQQTIAGVQHILGSAGFTTVNELWYWLVFTQFPTPPGLQCDVQATIYRDNNGALGAQVATTGPVATFDGVTAMSGQAAFNVSGAALGIGGGSANVHTLSLFGPGGWTFSGANGAATGAASAAWEQTTTNTYPGGVVTSFGAARVDLPPSGTVGAAWESFSGGAPAGSSAIPTATGNVMQASANVRSTGLSGTAALSLQLREWDASGNLLRATTLQSLSGNQAAWVKLSGSATIGATTAYCSVLLQVSDATAGASANATVWWDNTQCWNQTTTGQTVMPYCELRFPQSPAQLLLTGVQGDMVAPALMDYGTVIPTSYVGFTTLTLTVGQRANPNAGGKLVYVPAITPSTGAAMGLDSTVYGGCYATTVGSTSAIVPNSLSPTESALLGWFRQIVWVKPTNTSYASQTIAIQDEEFLSATLAASAFGTYLGAVLNLGASASVWLPSDAGALPIPFAAPIQREDYTQKWIGLSTFIAVNSTSGTPTKAGPTVLLPVDGGLVRVALGNVTGPPASENSIWVYNDGPLASTVDAGQSAATGPTGGGWRYSAEPTPIPNPAHAAGGVGANGLLTIQPLADNYLLLDPTNSGGNGGVPISQMAAYLKDSANGIDGTMPLYVEAHYTPLYLYPRQN